MTTTHQLAAVSQRPEREADSCRPPAARGRLVLFAAALTVAGLIVGRTVSDGRSAAGTAQPAAAAASITAVHADDVARLEATIAAHPDDVRALQQVSVAYVRRAAYGDPSYYDLARRSLQRAISLAPRDDTTLIARGVLELSLHHFEQALTLGETVHARSPDLNDPYAVLVDASIELGHYSQAERYLQQLADRRPGLPAYARVSYLRELHGDLDGAVEAMQLAATAGGASSADVASVTVLLGDVEFSRGNVNAAAGAYRHALRLVPQLPQAQLGAAKVEAARGDVRAAVRSLSALTQRLPLPSAVALLGDLQRSAGDVAASNRSYELVGSIARLQRASGQVTDLESAQFAADHGDAIGALRMARLAYRARPGNIFAADALAWARFRNGDIAGAHSLLSHVLRLGAADASLHWHAAAIFAAAGDVSRGRAELRAALTHNRRFTFNPRVQREIRSLAQQLAVRYPVG